MISTETLRRLDGMVNELKQAADRIAHESVDFPAVHRNMQRVLASIKMLELNISDITDLWQVPASAPRSEKGITPSLES